MIRVDTNSFIYGKDSFPQWFIDHSESGDVSYTYSADGSLVSTHIYTINGWDHVHKGDTIMQLDGNMTVIPSNVAQEFGVE